MISTLINIKIQFLIVFLSSFSFGMFFMDNPDILQYIGNFIGSIIGGAIITIIKNSKGKNEKND